MTRLIAGRNRVSLRINGMNVCGEVFVERLIDEPMVNTLSALFASPVEEEDFFPACEATRNDPLALEE